MVAMLSVLAQGFLMGLSYVAPIGMQNLYVINAAASGDRRRAACTAAFVVLFDLSLSLTCFFGIGVVMERLPWLSRALQLVGGLLVAAIGLNLMLPKRLRDEAFSRVSRKVNGVVRRLGLGMSKEPGERGRVARKSEGESEWGRVAWETKEAGERGRGVLKTAGNAFVVTWCNPQAVLDGTLMLGAFRATFAGRAALAFVAGVCLASIVWFPSLAAASYALGSRMGDRVLRAINIVCGGIVLTYGLRLLLAFAGIL